MPDPKNKSTPIWHGNSAKIGNKDDVFTSKSYRNYTESEEYDFDSLPGSDDDLENARENNS